MIDNKHLNPVVTELFISGRKINISVVFITQSYFKLAKDVRLNSTNFFSMKIPSIRELQQIVLNHSSDNDLKYFIISIKNVPQYRILIWLMMQLYHHIFL